MPPVVALPLSGPSDVTEQATATADVTCLNVVQNQAAIGGHVVKFSGDFTPTRGLLFNATDNTSLGSRLLPTSSWAPLSPTCPDMSCTWSRLPDHLRRRLHQAELSRRGVRPWLGGSRSTRTRQASTAGALKARNGQVVASGQGYDTRAAAIRGTQAVQRAAEGATLHDPDTKASAAKPAEGSRRSRAWPKKYSSTPYRKSGSGGSHG